MGAVLTRDQVRRVDHLAINRYGISGLVLMENAGRHAASIIAENYGTIGGAFICCGPGNNGGDGCVIARHLHNVGWSVRVMVTSDESAMTPDALANYRIIEAMGLMPLLAPDWEVQKAHLESIHPDEVVIDALLGTGFRGRVRNPTAELIDAINAATKRAVVAIDVPSGLDCDAGAASNATIRADLTITFVARKSGFDCPAAAPYLGWVEVADIGAPRELIAAVASGQAD